MIFEKNQYTLITFYLFPVSTSGSGIKSDSYKKVESKQFRLKTREPGVARLAPKVLKYLAYFRRAVLDISYFGEASHPKGFPSFG